MATTKNAAKIVIIILLFLIFLVACFFILGLNTKLKDKVIVRTNSTCLPHEKMMGINSDNVIVCAADIIGGGGSGGGLAAEVDPYWHVNWTAFNSSWSNTFNATTNDSINNYIGTIAAGGEPLWNANFTAFNESWSYTYNQTTNDSINNYILYVNSTNTGGGGSYSDTWINQTIYNMTEVDDNITLVNNTLYGMLNNGTYSATGIDTFAANYTDFLNKVDWSDVNNGTIATVETLWNANYSTFLTHMSWPNLINGTYWGYVMNGTVVKSSELNNGTYFRTNQWNATNTSYALLTTLNNGTYSVIDTDTFVANYTTFLSHMSWPNLINGTYWGYVMNGTVVKSSELNNGTYFRTNQWNATNASYALLTTLNNGTYSAVDTDTFVANYTTFLSHMSWPNLINGTYWGYVMNGTVVKSSELNNGTYFRTNQWNATNTSYALLTTLNNGTYSAVDTDTFVANYTTFLTHMSWPNLINGTYWGYVMNGTVVKSSELNNGTYFRTTQWNATNTSYALLTTINNGTYSAVDTDTFVANYTTFLSHMSWPNLINGTYWGYIMNGTVVKSSELNNGTYFRTNQWNATNTSYRLENNNTFNGVSAFNITGSSPFIYLFKTGTYAGYAEFYNDGNAHFTAENTGQGSKLFVFSGNDIAFRETKDATTLVNLDMNGGGNIVASGYISSQGINISDRIIVNNASVTNALATKITWPNLINGTYWGYVMNGTVVKSSELNNGTYFRTSQWNATNTSYALLTTLNNGTYSAVDTDTFVANYTTFLSHMSWPNLINGTYWGYVMNGTVVKSSELNNGTYFRTSQWNATNTSYRLNNNNTIYGNVDIYGDLEVEEDIYAYGNLEVDGEVGILLAVGGSISTDDSNDLVYGGQSSVVVGDDNHVESFDSLINGYNNYVTGSDVFVSGRYNRVTPAVSTYGFAAGLLNNVSGQHSFAIGERIVSKGLYSIGIGQELIANGTASIGIGDTVVSSGYASLATGFGSKAYGDYSTAMGRSITVNGDYSFGIGLSSGAGVLNADNVMSIMGGNVGIGTVTPNEVLSVNGNASFVNDIWVQGINITDRIATNNASVTNSINSKLNLSGGTMTGNLNLSANVNLTMNGGNQVSSNVTCVTIKGSTVTMLIC
jgi:hypothetical protein